LRIYWEIKGFIERAVFLSELRHLNEGYIILRKFQAPKIKYQTNPNDPNSKFDSTERFGPGLTAEGLVAGQINNPFTVVPSDIMTGRSGFAKPCDKILMDVMVIEHWNLRFICNLMLEIWDFLAYLIMVFV